MNTIEHNNRLMISTLSSIASNRADKAGKMLTAVNRANTLEQARKEIAEILAFMQHVDVLHEEQYRLKERR